MIASPEQANPITGASAEDAITGASPDYAIIGASPEDSSSVTAAQNHSSSASSSPVTLIIASQSCLSGVRLIEDRLAG